MPITLKQDLETVDKVIKVQEIATALGVESPVAVDFIRYSLANALLFERKNQDYGPKNIAEFGAFGCLVRMSDKYSRLKHLYQNRRKKATNESITDSWRDLPNYGIIALLCEDGKWR